MYSWLFIDAYCLLGCFAMWAKNASLVPDIMKEHGIFILLVPHNA
jgi:hypothetical protein